MFFTFSTSSVSKELNFLYIDIFQYSQVSHVSVSNVHMFDCASKVQLNQKPKLFVVAEQMQQL